MASAPAGSAADPASTAIDGVPVVDWAVETQPVPGGRDAADDTAIWVDGADPTRSLIIGTDKKGDDGLLVYDLAGIQLQATGGAAMNNVDLATDVPIGGRVGILVVASTIDDRTLELFELDPDARTLEAIAGGSIKTGIRGAGVCLARTDAALYVFATRGNGAVQQWRIPEAIPEDVEAQPARELEFDSRIEGCVADDAAGFVYLAEERTGIWRVSADPDAADDRRLVAPAGGGELLTPDVEGLAIAGYDDGRRFLIASSQGDDRFVVHRVDGAAPEFVGEFRVSGPGGDDVTHTDGVSVTTQALGTGTFAAGMLVVQDDENEDAGGELNQNFKLVGWATVAERLGID